MHSFPDLSCSLLSHLLLKKHYLIFAMQQRRSSEGNHRCLPEGGQFLREGTLQRSRVMFSPSCGHAPLVIA